MENKLTKKEEIWISKLEKVLSQMPPTLRGFLHNGEQIDFYREGFEEIPTWERESPIASITLENCHIDSGAY